MNKKIIAIQGGFPALSVTFILDQITGLIDRGMEIENWATYRTQDKTVHKSVTDYQLLDKTRFLNFPLAQFRNDSKKWISEFFKLNNIQNIEDVAAFHVHYGPNFNQLEPLFRNTDKRVVVSFHGYDASRHIKSNGPDCYEYLFSRADLITTPSSVMRERLIEIGCPAEKVIIHRYGVDLTRFSPIQKPVQEETVKLLSVARLVEKKGLEHSLRAFAGINPELKATYRIIGDGELKESLQSLTLELKIEDRVVFLGSVDTATVQEEMKQADIFVLTSITAADGDEEGLPVSIIEAQAMGLPVISSFHAGIPELVSHQHSGLLSEEKDVETIKFHMDCLIGNPSLRRQFSRKALERVKSEFDIVKLNDQLKAHLLDEILTTSKQENISAGKPEEAKNTLLKQLDKISWSHKRDVYYDLFEDYEVVRETKHPAISIVIISWKFNEKTLANLIALNKQSDTNFELIFVNNGAPDAEFESFRPFIHKYVRLNKNTGAYLARNAGALFGSAPILLFLDDDAIPAVNLVSSHLNEFAQYDVIVVRGQVRPITNNPLNRLAGHYNLGYKPYPVYTDIEGNTSYQTEAFLKVGGWDDGIDMGGGGAEISFRLLQIEPDYRKQIYSPNPIIFHDYVKDIEHLQKKLARQKISKERLCSIHSGWDDYRATWDPYRGRTDLLIKKSKPKSDTSSQQEVANATSGKKITETKIIEELDTLDLFQERVENGAVREESAPRKILFVNHSIPPLEHSGTPLSTLNHLQNFNSKGAKTAVLIPYRNIQGVQKDIQKEFTLYKIPALDKHNAFFGLYNADVLEFYKKAIELILNDFQPDVVQINDYVCLPSEIIEMLKTPENIVVRNVCNDEEICHFDRPVLPSGTDAILCSGPESAKKCSECFVKNKAGQTLDQYGSEKLMQLNHGLQNKRDFLDRAYSSIVDGVIFTENNYKKHFLKFVNVPEENIRIIPRGFTFDTPRNLTPVNFNKDRVTFGYIAHLAFSKGIGLVLKAFEKIAPTHDFTLKICGGVVNIEYINLIKELEQKYPGKIKYEGEFQKNNFEQVIEGVDLSIIPSYFDSYNRLLRELMYYGVPSIVTNFHGASIIKDGINGLKINVGDSVALADCMIKVIKDPSVIEKLSQGVVGTSIPTLDDETGMMSQFYEELQGKKALSSGEHKEFSGSNSKNPLQIFT